MARPPIIKSTQRKPTMIKTEEVTQEVAAPVVRAEGERTQRKRRGVFNGMRQKLQVIGEMKGYHLCWINDIPGMIAQAKEGGYEFVSENEIEMANNNVVDRNNSEGTHIKVLVGTNEDNSGMFAYLMKIRDEYFDEDQADIQSYNDKIDAQICGGNVEGSVGRDGRYIPSQGISIK